MTTTCKPSKRRRRKKRSTKFKRYTPEYIKWRIDVKTRDGNICLKCKKKLMRLHVHHIEPYSKNPTLRIDITNGGTLCRKCHKLYHKIYGITKNVNRKTFLEFLQPLQKE